MTAIGVQAPQEVALARKLQDDDVTSALSIRFTRPRRKLLLLSALLANNVIQ